MKERAVLYYLFRSAMGRSIRGLLGFLFFFWLLSDLGNDVFPHLSGFFVCLFLITEIYFRFRIGKHHPRTTVAENDKKNIFASFTLPAMYTYLTRNTTAQLLEDLLTHKEVQFLLHRAQIAPDELRAGDVKLEDIASYAFDLVKSINGKYVTSMDLFAAFLLLSEEQSKLLFNKELRPEHMMHILLWARITYPREETPKKLRLTPYGGGIGEALVTGWTLETKKYTQDFSYTAIQHDSLLTGREQEFGQLITGLSKPENNNVLLIGDIGSGKESLVAAFAQQSFLGKLSGNLANKKVLELMIGQLVAGATDRGDLEVRLQAIIEEIAHSGNVLVYIPEFQNLMGGTSYGLNLSGALLPYMKDSQLPIIATISPGNFKAYMEQSPLKEVFTVVKLSEPDKGTATQMLFSKTQDIEARQRVIITYKAVTAAVQYANRYLQDEVLPGSAVTLLADAANAVATSSEPKYKQSRLRFVTEEDVTAQIEQRAHVAVAAPKKEEKELLLHLEEELHKRVIAQDEAVTVISEAMRRLRSGLANQNKPISFLFLGPTGVGKTETAKALASLYFGGEENMIRLDMSEYNDETGVKRLLGAAPGEGDERGELTDKIHDKPFSLVLLDEFEKAHPKILDLFLQVLEDGRLTDNKGRTVSFVNSIIIATSNAGAEFIRQEIQKGTVVDKQFQSKLLDYLQSNKLFKPELVNRFDDVVTFKPLGQKEVAIIAKLMLEKLQKTLAEQDIALSFDDKILAKISLEGYDQQFGARPLRRYMQDNIEDVIAQKKLKDEIKRGSQVLLTTDDAGAIVAHTV
jgi:ATP-dependent Clp protease ATP-binding subunit ClpA